MEWKIDQYFENAHRFINSALYDIDSALIATNPFDDDVKDGDKVQPIKDRMVLVHCQGGVSRSSSIIISYLMNTKRMRLKEAIEYVSERRPAIAPNSGFMKQLERYEQSLYGNDNQSFNAKIGFFSQKEKTVCCFIVINHILNAFRQQFQTVINRRLVAVFLKGVEIWKCKQI